MARAETKPRIKTVQSCKTALVLKLCQQQNRTWSDFEGGNKQSMALTPGVDLFINYN